MRSIFRLVFVVFFFTLLMLLAVCLRNANDRVFYKVCAARVSHGRLTQELAAKQLRLESLINPANVSEQVDY